ncbi:replication initiation protein [Antarctic microvirus CAA_003_V_4]|nr:replication initiation protein [Antarctic microvirus CAA_003_V_4]
MCLTPINLKQKEAVVPCGKCPQCTARRTSAWSFRLIQEEKQSTTAYFITLTYADKNLHYKDANTRPTLIKRDLQLFFKRLRKANPNTRPIKYFAVGEYGEKTWRPHYHVILFNAEIETIQKAWHLGTVHYAIVNEQTVGYTLKYISKPKPSKYALRNRNQQFQLQSQGLGKNYLTKAMLSWHKKEIPLRSYCNLQDGKKITMPRYYKDKIYNADERLQIHNAQLEKLQKEHELFMSDFDVNYHNLTQSINAIKKHQSFNLKPSLL